MTSDMDMKAAFDYKYKNRKHKYSDSYTKEKPTFYGGEDALDARKLFEDKESQEISYSISRQNSNIDRENEFDSGALTKEESERKYNSND